MYSIPSSLTISNTKTMNGTSFLLLNTEYQMSANILGFELYAAKAESINIQVVSFNFDLNLSKNYLRSLLKIL